MVISEEQVRLFALPSISLRQKARITAKDGFRIKIGNIIAFGQFSSMHISSLVIPFKPLSCVRTRLNFPLLCLGQIDI